MLYTIKSWDGRAPEQIEGLDAARRRAEVRAIFEGAAVKLYAPLDQTADFLQFQTVTADGHWSKWSDEPLPGSLSELDANEADAEQ